MKKKKVEDKTQLDARSEKTLKIASKIREVGKKTVQASGKLLKQFDVVRLKIGDFHIKIAKDGKNTIMFVCGAFVVSFIGLGFGFITTALLFFLLLTLYFFRDPHRVLPERKNVVVAPCDGLILNIETSSLPQELSVKDKREYTKISTFMNVTDMHIQRMPVDCVVKQIEYVKGAFINASLDKASKDNERNIVLVERENGDHLCIVQIAGFVARRIVCHVEKDEQCKIGEKYGMIKFGSRIELYIPKHYKVEVLKGQRLVCGETVVASFEK